MPTHTPHTSDTERNLDFWERGPVRQVIEAEFELGLMRYVREQGTFVGADTEKRLHDLIIPQVFLFIDEHFRYSEEKSFTLHRRQQLQECIFSLLSRELATSIQNAPQEPSRRLQELTLFPLMQVPEVVWKSFFS